MGIIKSGKVVVVLAGRYAGRKAVVVKSQDEGNDGKKFGHAIVAGIDRYPRRVTKSMGKAKLTKRSKVKPFLKAINFSHIMPTRYSVDFDLKKLVDEEALNVDKRHEVRKEIKKVFEERYLHQTAKSEKKASGVQYFFKRLRF